jgi:mRNA-degrading endonuclease RelE of RelBE toxin-antitoxin system
VNCWEGSMASDAASGRSISFTSEFGRNVRHLAKKYPHVLQDLEGLFDELRKGGTPGDKIAGVGVSVYKTRLQNTDARKGKSGGYRCIYQVQGNDRVVLVTLYSKSEQGDVSKKVIAQIIKQSSDT